MHHTIVTSEIGGRDHPNIFSQLSISWNDLLPTTMVEQPEIKSGDGVAALLEEVNKMSPNVASVSGDENFHAHFPRKSNDSRCHNEII
jgi:hypothetical protein